MFPDIGFGNAVNGVGTTQIGYGSFGGYAGNTYIMGDNIVWVKGKHTFKFGGNYWKQQINSSGGMRQPQLQLRQRRHRDAGRFVRQ